MTPTDDTLPPLPEPRDLDGARWGYDAEDMRNYAVDAYVAGVAQERERHAADARDAARYRWLRDVPSDWAICEWLANDPDGLGYYRDGRAAHVVDAAIDVAIRASCAPADPADRAAGATPPAAPAQ